MTPANQQGEADEEEDADRRVEVAASRLGIRDLNRAAVLIDWDWANDPV